MLNYSPHYVLIRNLGVLTLQLQNRQENNVKLSIKHATKILTWEYFVNHQSKYTFWTQGIDPFQILDQLRQKEKLNSEIFLQRTHD